AGLSSETACRSRRKFATADRLPNAEPPGICQAFCIAQSGANQFRRGQKRSISGLPPTAQSNLSITACLAQASANLKNQPQPPVISALKTEFMACSLIWDPHPIVPGHSAVAPAQYEGTAPAASTASHADRLQQTFIDGLSSAIQHRIHLRLPARLKDPGIMTALSGSAGQVLLLLLLSAAATSANAQPPPAPMPASMAASAAVGRKGSPPLTSAAAVVAADLQDAAPWDEDDALAELGDA
uniref:DBR1 domain-containing protein n=1 Tax=Macrostomum lignano TaxID=282301 RepID=A0A1I8H1F0_9PLAT